MRRFDPKTDAESGQASLEYLLVGLLLVAMISAVGTLWQTVSSGSLSNLVEAHASHALAQMGGIVDASLF